MKNQSNTKINAYIADYRFEKEEIRLNVKIRLGASLEYRKGKYSVILKDREGKSKLILDVKSIDLMNGDFGIEVALKAKEYVSTFKKDITDVYVRDNENNLEVLVSARGSMKNFKPFYSKELKTFIKMHRVNGGNLGIVSNSKGKSVVVTDIEISKAGVMTVEGMVDCYKLDSVGVSGKLNGIRVKNAEKVINAEVEVFENEDSAYRFKCAIDLMKCGKDDEIVKGKVYLVFGKDEIEISLNQPKKKIVSTNIVKDESEKVWLLKVAGKREVKFIIEDVSEDIEFRELYVNKGEIELNIEKETSSVNFEHNKKIEMILKKQGCEREYCAKCRVRVGEVINVTAYLDELSSRESIDLGEYEVYLRVNGKDRRLSSRNDQVFNKKDIVKFPKMDLINMKKVAVSLKPYYTDKNTISIIVEKILEVVSVESVVTNVKGITIKGKMNIKNSLETEDNRFTGILKMKLFYGIEIELPYEAKVSPIENDEILHNFKIEIPKGVIKAKNYNINYLAKNMSNQIVVCYVEGAPEKRSFALNIKARDVKTEFSEKAKENKVGKLVMNSLSKPMYNVMNKILPISNNMIVFQSYKGEGYNCNPKAIYEELLETENTYKCIWVSEDISKDLPGLPKVVKPNSFQYYYCIARARYLVSNAEMPVFYKKRSGSSNIMTWRDSWMGECERNSEKETITYRLSKSNISLEELSKWDKVIVENEYIKKAIEKELSCDNEKISVARPKNNIFKGDFEKRSLEIKNKLSIPSDKKIVLYAPILDKNNKGEVSIPFSVNGFVEELGKDYILLLKLNYKGDCGLENMTYHKNVINVSLYMDMEELVLISDMIVTNKSSMIVEYVEAKKPVLLMGNSDKKVLQVNGSGIKVEVPGKIISNEKELFNAIKNVDKTTKECNKRYVKISSELKCEKTSNKVNKISSELF